MSQVHHFSFSANTSPSQATIISLSPGCGQWPYLGSPFCHSNLHAPESIPHWGIVVLNKTQVKSSHGTSLLRDFPWLPTASEGSPDSCLWITRSWSPALYLPLQPPHAVSYSHSLNFHRLLPSVPRNHLTLGLCASPLRGLTLQFFTQPLPLPGGHMTTPKPRCLVQCLCFLQSLFQPIFIEQYFFWGSRDTI